jgi:hypothetical protein
MSKRQPFRLTAFIDVGDGAPLHPCAITDISISGARISVTTANDLPSDFSLAMTFHGKVRRHCRVTWRSDAEIGVVFVPAPKQFQASAVLPIPAANDGPAIAHLVELD